MKKFKTLKILGVAYTVSWKPQKDVASLTPDSPFTIGLCDGLDDSIHVSNDLKTKAMRRVLAHEWIHGIAEVNGINQSIDPSLAEVHAQSGANATLELLEQVDVVDFLLSDDVKKKLYTRWKKSFK